MSRCHVQGRGWGAGNGVGKVKGQGVDALFPCWGGGVDVEMSCPREGVGGREWGR